jgi:uncharacterized membrane protein
MTNLRERMFSPFVQKELQTEWRAREITRIEGFSDAVFGFAVTLLVVAIEVPHTSGELLQTMRGFGSFLFTFGVLFSIWYRQFIFFRRYGLEDGTTIVLNGALLVVVLFFVFPLKFIFSALLSRLEGGSKLTKLVDGTVVPIIRPEHFPYLIAIYGLGFAAVFIVFAVLYRHAYRHRDILKLTDIEAYDTLESFSNAVWVAVVGTVVAVMSVLSAITGFFSTENGQTIVAVVEILPILKMVRVRSTRRKRRENFLSDLSARTAALQ